MTENAAAIKNVCYTVYIIVIPYLRLVNQRNYKICVELFELDEKYKRLIPLTQAGLYVVGAARGTGRRVCEDCLD
jgi:hypothetical protein